MKTTGLVITVFLLGACGGADPDDGSGTGDPSPSAGAEDTGGDVAAECSFEGTWVGQFVGGPNEGETITWAFGPGGAVHTEFTSVAFDGEWTIEGAVVAVTDTSETPCTGVTGRFEVTYEGGCDTVRVRSTDDACDPRRTSTDGMTMTRR